jgi:hypothetical protein
VFQRTLERFLGGCFRVAGAEATRARGQRGEQAVVIGGRIASGQRERFLARDGLTRPGTHNCPFSSLRPGCAQQQIGILRRSTFECSKPHR